MNCMSIGLETDIGNRKVQQDAAIVSTNDREEDAQVKKTIAILCDGMGGMRGGERASNLCTNRIYNDFYENDMLSDYNTFLMEEIDKTDCEVVALEDEEGAALHAGTTLVAVIIEDNKLYWASVGDSRLYIIREGEIVQITKDHNYMMLLMDKVEKNEITLEEALTDKEREALISYIGINGIRYIDSNKNDFELLPGDCLVICSDGLYRSVSDENIKEIVQASDGDMQTAAKFLVEAALDMGSKHQDNTTVITIQYLGI